MNSPFLNAPIGGARANYADMDMKLDCFVSENADVCVFHDKPFSKTLSWIEYDTRTSKLDFIMEDGDTRNFGIPVDRKLSAYFHNAHIISIIQLNPATKDVENGMDLPLIIHAA
jgi:hypothetical protein